MSSPRASTNRLLEMIDAGLLTSDAVLSACLSYMSDADVEDMAIANEFFVDTDDDMGEYNEDYFRSYYHEI